MTRALRVPRIGPVIAVERWLVETQNSDLTISVTFQRRDIETLTTWARVSGYDTLDTAIRAAVLSVVEGDPMDRYEREAIRERCDIASRLIYEETKEFLDNLDRKIAAMVNERLER